LAAPPAAAGVAVSAFKGKRSFRTECRKKAYECRGMWIRLKRASYQALVASVSRLEESRILETICTRQDQLRRACQSNMAIHPNNKTTVKNSMDRR